MALQGSKNIKVSYRRIHELVGEVCHKVIEDNFKPYCLIGISSGGLMPVRIAKTFLQKGFGIKNLPVYVIGYSNYDEKNKQLPEPIMIQRLDEDLEKKVMSARVLVVDEVDHSRRTLEKATDYLLGLGVKDLRVLVLHSKECDKRGKLPNNVKFYYAEETPDIWIDYEYEFTETFGE